MTSARSPASGRGFDRIVSLGTFCETAHQIRRFTGVGDAQFFDWLVTPYHSLIRVLQTDFQTVFHRDRLQLSADGSTVVDTDNGLQFHHSFSRGADERIDASTLDREYREARAKVDFLIERWHAMVGSGERILYVILADIGHHDAVRLAAVLHGLYPDQAFKLLWARRPSTSGGVLPADDVIAVTVVGGHGPAAWAGDDAAWDAAFGHALRTG